MTLAACWEDAKRTLVRSLSRFSHFSGVGAIERCRQTSVTKRDFAPPGSTPHQHKTKQTPTKSRRKGARRIVSFFPSYRKVFRANCLIELSNGGRVVRSTSSSPAGSQSDRGRSLQSVVGGQRGGEPHCPTSSLTDVSAFFFSNSYGRRKERPGTSGEAAGVRSDASGRFELGTTISLSGQSRFGYEPHGGNRKGVYAGGGLSAGEGDKPLLSRLPLACGVHRHATHNPGRKDEISLIRSLGSHTVRQV